MPLLKRATESNPHRLAHPELWSRSRPADVLVDINFAGLTGSLGQLAVLCADAAEIFDGLLRIADETHERLEGLTKRAARVVVDLSELELRVAADDGVDALVARAPGASRAARARRWGQPPSQPSLFSAETNCNQVEAARARARALPPGLIELDAHIGGHACAMAFSDPGF